MKAVLNTPASEAMPMHGVISQDPTAKVQSPWG